MSARAIAERAVAAAAGAWYLAAESRQAREFAKRVKESEKAGTVGAWADWQRFIDGWPIDSADRKLIDNVFGTALDFLDEEDIEYDRVFADVW